MSELTKKLRERVELRIAPLAKYMGEDSPPVRMALDILQDAEDIERELAEERVSTERAAELTGWNVNTLQSKARQKLGGEPMRNVWSQLEVEDTAQGYVFVLGSIPKKLKATG